MIQVVVSYLDGRFSCFFVKEPVELYADLVSKIKEAVPYIRNLPDSKIRVAYKDNKLGVFIAIAPYNDLVLQEAFRNAYDCGAETFRRLELEIREIDSPFIAAKSRRGKVNESETTSTTTKAMRNASSVKYSEENASDVTSHKQLNFDSESDSESENEVVTGKGDWKNTKIQTLNVEYQEVHDELVALEAQIDELSRPVVEPPPEGTYKSIVCGNCHLRGHRAEGNRNNAACTKPACVSYISCGQRKKHAEHFEEIKKLKKRQKELKEELDTVEKNKKNLAAFESKTISAFSVAVTGRLLKAFPDRYDTKTAMGKIKLQKDIATIRLASNNKVPPVSLDDRAIFTEMLEKQQQKFDQINIDHMKGKSKDVFTTNYVNNTKANCPSTSTSIVNISPVSTKKSKKKKRSSSSSSNSTSSDSSSESQADVSSDSDAKKRKHKRSRNGKRKRRKGDKKYKHGRKRRQRRETQTSNSVEENSNIFRSTVTEESSAARTWQERLAAASHLSEIPTGSALHPNDLMAMNFAHQRQREIPVGPAFYPMAMNFQQQPFMQPPFNALVGAAKQQMNFIEPRLYQSMFIPTAITNEAESAFEEQDLEKDKGPNFEQPTNTLEEFADVAGNSEKL